MLDQAERGEIKRVDWEVLVFTTDSTVDFPFLQNSVICNSCKIFEKILFAEFLFNLIKTNLSVTSQPFFFKFQQFL